MQSSEDLSFGMYSAACTLLIQADIPFGFAMEKTLIIYNTCFPFIQLFYLVMNTVFCWIRYLNLFGNRSESRTTVMG